jgi:hypothetical protein
LDVGHYGHEGLGSQVAFLAIFDGAEFVHHILDVSSVFGQVEFFSLDVVVVFHCEIVCLLFVVSTPRGWKEVSIEASNLRTNLDKVPRLSRKIDSPKCEMSGPKSTIFVLPLV